MRIIVGLGNPGEKYKNTRHNIGFLVVDILEKTKLRDVVVKKSSVFMNESGTFVKDLLSKHPKSSASNLYVVHDDLDIPLGLYKIQLGKGPKEHKGLESIDSVLGTNQYWRVRVGVDNRDSKNRVPGEEYVLQDFTKEERGVLDKTIKEICKKLATL